MVPKTQPRLLHFRPDRARADISGTQTGHLNIRETWRLRCSCKVQVRQLRGYQRAFPQLHGAPDGLRLVA
eukprot:2014468-Prymnesium_polylepis.1